MLAEARKHVVILHVVILNPSHSRYESPTFCNVDDSLVGRVLVTRAARQSRYGNSLERSETRNGSVQRMTINSKSRVMYSRTSEST